jgi:hypothetical protein
LLSMKVLLTPAVASLNAVRHIAWYVGYHTARSRHDLTR